MNLVVFLSNIFRMISNMSQVDVTKKAECGDLQNDIKHV